jgi:hypothetical protein
MHPDHLAVGTTNQNFAQSNPHVQLLRSAAQRLRRIKGLARSDKILRRLPSNSFADDAGSAECAMAALRTLLASDLPLEELVRMSFQPELLDRELRRIRGVNSRDATATPTPASAPAAARASGSFSFDFAMAPDCKAAALQGKR